MRRGSRKNRILDYWVGIPLLRILTLGRRHRLMPPRIAKVGVICSPALGDTILFSGVLQDLRRHFGAGSASPRAEIIHFCMDGNVAAAEMVPGADRRVLIELTEPLSTIRKIRSERLDVMLDFTSWQRLTAFYTLVSGARFTAGFETPGQHRERGYDLKVLHTDGRHEVENFRAILRLLAIPVAADPAVDLPEGEFAEFDEDLVVFHPWASGQRGWLREWPEERWTELALRLNRAGTEFVLTGSHADLARSEPLVRRMEQAGLKARAFASSDGFRSLIRLLLRARVVVSVNTGVMHLAAVSGVPTVAINGPNRNGRWGPVGPRALGIEAPGTGCGYLHLGFNFDGQPTDCMERTSVEQVVEGVKAVTRHGASTEYGVLVEEPVGLGMTRPS